MPNVTNWRTKDSSKMVLYWKHICKNLKYRNIPALNLIDKMQLINWQLLIIIVYKLLGIFLSRGENKREHNFSKLQYYLRFKELSQKQQKLPRTFLKPQAAAKWLFLDSKTIEHFGLLITLLISPLSAKYFPFSWLEYLARIDLVEDVKFWIGTN